MQQRIWWALLGGVVPLLAGCRLPEFLGWWKAEPAAVAATPTAEAPAPAPPAVANAPATTEEVPASPRSPDPDDVPPPAEAKPETPAREVDAAALIPSFEAPQPTRVAMPVPVFAEGVDLEALVPGWVEVRLTINPEGVVTKAEVVDSSNRELDEPVRQAFLAARYEPTVDPLGRPVQVVVVERIEF